jgi:hypothetical protein
MGTNEASVLEEVRGGAVAGRTTGETGSISSSTERDGPCCCFCVGIEQNKEKVAQILPQNPSEDLDIPNQESRMTQLGPVASEILNCSAKLVFGFQIPQSRPDFFSSIDPQRPFLLRTSPLVDLKTQLCCLHHWNGIDHGERDNPSCITISTAENHLWCREKGSHAGCLHRTTWSQHED